MGERPGKVGGRREDREGEKKNMLRVMGESGRGKREIKTQIDVLRASFPVSASFI